MKSRTFLETNITQDSTSSFAPGIVFISLENKHGTTTLRLMLSAAGQGNDALSLMPLVYAII
jgi:uncharacterized protein YqjF (DUF2071 family)